MTRPAGVVRSTTDELLLLCIQPSSLLQQDRMAARLRELMRDADWDAVWHRAGEQHVQPLVARTLADQALAGCLPDHVLQQAKAARMQTLLHNMPRHAELEQIGRVFHSHGIPVVPLKGTTLALRAFGSLDSRRCNDIDILVPPASWERAWSLLSGMGYEPIEAPKPGVAQHAFHDVPLLKWKNESPIIVELHHQLTDTRFITVDDDKLWKRILQHTADDAPLRPLPIEELLVFLAVHLPKHASGLLRLLADIHHLVSEQAQSIDWEHTMRLAREWHAEDVVSFSLQAAQSLLGTPLPPEVRTELRPAAWKRGLVNLLAGERAMLYPPAPDHLRANRFRLAYCLMLTPLHRVLRSYWHYMLVPPQHPRASRWGTAIMSASRPAAGIMRTIVAVGRSLFEHRTRPASLP
jgi:hypothetical protein